MQIQIYNTMHRKIEEFFPVHPQRVTIYSCGPTVYSRQHLGNLRAAFLVDLYKNVVKYIGGYTVTHVMNITDVGHLTGDNEGDADHGEDKMEKWARQQGITARDVADKFTKIYLEDLWLLHIDAFEVMPRATNHIAEQIMMIQELEVKGYTYIIENDGVYMDTSKVVDYGKLIGKKHMDWLEQWARVDDAGKRNVTDFALWKFNITGKKRDMEWESPRWVGFPGWHIECSAMSMKYLWDHIDIHTGGMEHIAIHHTNEICQSECSHGHTPRVNYRIHNQWLMMNGKKIAKSDGNVAFMNEVIENGYKGEDLRYFFLQAHYRSFQDFSRDSLESASKARKNLHQKISKRCELLNISQTRFDDFDLSSITNHEHEQIAEKLATDFMSPTLLASLFALIQSRATEEQILKLWQENNASRSLETTTEEQKNAWKIISDDLRFLFALDTHILKLSLFSSREEIVVPASIQDIAERRRQAKITKDRVSADLLRQELADAWRTMQDEKDGYQIQKM